MKPYHKTGACYPSAISYLKYNPSVKKIAVDYSIHKYNPKINTVSQKYKLSLLTYCLTTINKKCCPFMRSNFVNKMFTSSGKGIIDGTEVFVLTTFASFADVRFSNNTHVLFLRSHLEN